MKRIKAKPRCANPLFVSWLEDWKEEAKSRGSEMQYCFGKALNSLRKCPLPLKSGRECIILENFGPKLCAMLDKKLTEYKLADLDNAASKQEAEVDYNVLVNNANDNNSGNKLPAPHKRGKINAAQEQPAKKIRTPKADAKQNLNDRGSYIPAWRSGGYAILLTLYEKSQDPNFIGYMGKADLQADAQKHCDNSLKKPEPGTRYTAWSSMSTLIEKGLVIRNSNPAKFRLTDAGLAVAMQLSEVDENDALFGSASKSSEATSAREKRFQNIDDDPFLIEAPGNSSRERNERLEFGSILTEDPKVKTILPEKKTNYGNKNTVDRPETLDNNFERTKTSSANERTVVLGPKNFDVVLIVDDRETAGGKTRPKDDATLAELTQSKVRFEVRNLKIGDFTWIARCRDSGEELILPYIVERKRMDDFGGSIKDGRYHEQKFRLKKSGIENVTYLIEHHGNNQFTGLPLTTLYQAATNTLVQDGFNVKYTKCHRDSMFYLASMTVMLTNIYQEKTLVGCEKEDLVSANAADDLIQLMLFKDFNKAAAKVKIFKAREMFIRQLIQLQGLSVEKALAIVDVYPTPTALKNAYDKLGSGGEYLLAGIQFGATKRLLGPVLSKTLHQFYTRKDF